MNAPLPNAEDKTMTIQQHEICLESDQDVSGLEVAVNHASAVGIGDGLPRLHQEKDR